MIYDIYVWLDTWSNGILVIYVWLDTWSNYMERQNKGTVKEWQNEISDGAPGDMPLQLSSTAMDCNIRTSICWQLAMEEM